MQWLGQRAASALLIGVFAFPSLAQVQNGQFNGVTTDPLSAVISNARVTITNTATGYSVVVYSNPEGLWSAQELLVGEYRITVEAPGFRTATSEKLTLNAGSIVRINFKTGAGPAPGNIGSKRSRSAREYRKRAPLEYRRFH